MLAKVIDPVELVANRNGLPFNIKSPDVLASLPGDVKLSDKSLTTGSPDNAALADPCQGGLPADIMIVSTVKS